MTTPARIPPHCIEAEQHILGALMLDSSLFKKVNAIIKPDDFYDYKNTFIYEIIIELITKNKPTDVITVAEEVDKYDTSWNLDGASVLKDLIDFSKNAPSIENVEAYAEIIRERSVLRKLISTANDMSLQNDSECPCYQITANKTVCMPVDQRSECPNAECTDACMEDDCCVDGPIPLPPPFNKDDLDYFIEAAHDLSLHKINLFVNLSPIRIGESCHFEAITEARLSGVRNFITGEINEIRHAIENILYSHMCGH